MLIINPNIDLKTFAEENKFKYCRKTSTYPKRYHRSFDGEHWNFMQIYIETREIHTGSIDDDGVSDFIYDLIKKDIIIKKEVNKQMEIVNNSKSELFIIRRWIVC